MMRSLKLYIAIGAGGMIGATCRYSISLLVGYTNGFPTATFIANLLGCFLLSILLNSIYIKRMISPTLLTALSTGVIGAFTTFSTVAVEVTELLRINKWIAFTYVFTSIIGGLAMCYAGYLLSTRKKVNV